MKLIFLPARNGFNSANSFIMAVSPSFYYDMFLESNFRGENHQFTFSSFIPFSLMNYVSSVFSVFVPNKKIHPISLPLQYTKSVWRQSN